MAGVHAHLGLHQIGANAQPGPHRKTILEIAVSALSLVTNLMKTTSQDPLSDPLSILKNLNQTAVPQIQCSQARLLVGHSCRFLRQQSLICLLYLVAHLANSGLWVAAYQSLETLTPQSLVKLSLLDFFLSWKCYQSQHSGDSTNCFYYLDTETIRKLTGDPDHDNPLVQKCLGFDAQPINHAPIIFLVTFTQNTYFLALFDFSEKKALILGRLAPQQLDSVTAHAEWESWDGPVLWMRIGNAFHWLPSGIQAVRPAVVYEANWISVHFCFQ